MGVATSRVSGLGCLAVYTGAMAFHGPSYGLSRECAMKSQAKFSPERAKECVDWIEEAIGAKLEMEVKDQVDFGAVLKDGAVLCQLINAISPGSVKKINTMKAPFKQRENIEMYLKACAAYGQGARPLPGERPVRKQEPLYGGRQPLQPWWHDPEEWMGRPSAGGEAGDREQAPV